MLLLCHSSRDVHPAFSRGRSRVPVLPVPSVAWFLSFALLHPATLLFPRQVAPSEQSSHQRRLWRVSLCPLSAVNQLSFVFTPLRRAKKLVHRDMSSSSFLFLLALSPGHPLATPPSFYVSWSFCYPVFPLPFLSIRSVIRDSIAAFPAVSSANCLMVHIL